jgi:hypothetical protein
MTLQHEMEKLGRILAYDRDLTVQVRGTRAYSVPGRVVIPNAESYAHLGPNAERMLHGLLDHECGHARFTDHTIMERARKKGGESLASLVNALEDGRVERLMGDEFIGCRQNLHRKNRWFWEDAEWQKNFAASDPWSAFCTAATLVVRNSVSVPEIERVRSEVSDLLRAALAHGLDHFDNCKTSDDVYRLALSLWERFADPPPPPPPPQPEEDEEDEEDEDEPQDGDESDDENENDDASPPPKSKPEKDEGDDEDEDAPSGDSGEPDDEDDDGEGDGAQGSGPEGDDEDDTDGDDGGDAGPHDNAGDESNEDGKPSSEPSSGEGDEESEDDADTDDDGDPSDESADAPTGAGADEGGEPDTGDEGAPAKGGDEDEDGTEGGDTTENGGRVDPYRAIRELRLDKWEKGTSVVDPEEAIAKLMEQFEASGLYRNFSHEFDIERDFHAQQSHEALAEHFDDPPEDIERDALAASSALTQAFEVALKARRERRPVGGNDEGEVDLDIMGEYATGSATVDTIFRQWIAEDDRDVTVAIMLDCSGSMGATHSGRDHLARRVAHALHLALSACSIEHEITGFTTVSSRDHDSHPWTADMPEVQANFDQMRTALIEAHEHGVDPSLFAREMWRWNAGVSLRGLGIGRNVNSHDTKQVLRDWPLLVPVHAIFKPYGVSDARGLRYAHGIHENLDGEAVLWQARRLAARPEKRRVMFVLSDGMPSGARDNALGAEFLKECVQRVIAAGIEIYGIGIETDAVAHFYPRHWIANSVEHLMEVAFTSFAQVITEGRSEVECVTL